MESLYLLDKFVYTELGEPYLWMPYGTITSPQSGETFEFTREIAETAVLPHFKPPIKLGDHDDKTPAGGHIVGLQVREDGLYVVPEWNESGTAVVTTGAYRYHSPEVSRNGSILDSLTGKITSGFLVMGDALLHKPALGEAVAFYQASQTNGGYKPMAQDTVTVPTSWFDRLFKPESEPRTPEPPQPDNYAAQVKTLTAKIETFEAALAEKDAEIVKLKAQQENAAKISHFAAALADTAVAEDAELLTLLAGMEQEKADKMVQRFKALSAQAAAGAADLTKDVGHEGDGHGTGDKFNAVEAAVQQYRAEHQGVTYTQAVQHLSRTQPELFEGVA